MKRIVLTLALVLGVSIAANAQLGKKINITKAASAVATGAQALTISDDEIAAYAQEYIDWIDAHNKVCNTDDEDQGVRETAERLAGIVARLPLTSVNGRNLDIKALYVTNVNAFACANGSIRVFWGLMDIMTDDQILAVIGHEIGHVANNDSRDAFKTALLTSALKDAVGATGGTVAALSDSQLGDLSEALANAQFSQKQELQADDYGFNLLKKTDADPSNMAGSLNVLMNLSEETSSSNSSLGAKWFSSHPELQKRIDALNKKE